MRDYQFTLGHGYYHAFGRSFPFNETDRSSKQAAKTAMDNYAAEVISRRERIAGRKLSDKELAVGLYKPDNLTARDRIAIESWTPTPVAVETELDDNPFRNPEQRALTHPRNARREIYQKAEREWDERKQREADKLAHDSNPRRAKARQAAEEALEYARFSPDTTYRDVVFAEQMARQAEHDLDTFKQMHSEFVHRQSAIRDERRQVLNLQIAALEQQRDGLAEFEPEPEPEPEPDEPWRTYQPTQYETRSAAEYERLRAETERFDKERKARGAQ